MIDQRFSDNEISRRDIPSFIEPRPPLISNPFMRPRPQKGTNLLELFEEDSDCEEPELVQVYLRLKPCNTPSNMYEVKSDRCLITSLDTATVGHGRRTQHNVSKMYTFSHIFGPEANQKELFERIVKDNLKKLPEGHSFTLLTYGASGSGKTFTLMGTVAAPGLVPRSLEYVFKVVDAAQKPVFKPADNGAEKLSYAAQENELQFVKQIRHLSAPLREKYRRMSVQLHNDLITSSLDLSNRTKYYVWVSFVEIYNEGIYDLLSSNDRSASSKLVIREDSNGNVYVKGATQVFVRTGEEAYDVMVAGKHNLQVAATGVNAHSSRSHCIFTITMLTETEQGCRASSVRLCDLAGCERVRRTRNAGARLAESRAINSSLHVLERCLRTLRRRQRAGRDALVPYRESKLTRLLGAGLSGARGEAVCVVVTLNPAPDCAHETRHVLQLAAVARDIQVNNTVAEYSSLETSAQDSSVCSAELLKLRTENERLHFELLQAQGRARELVAAMEERQAASAATMQELVDEAKDMTRQYYEALLAAARDEMEEMKEEYEARLSKVAPQPAPRENTPSRLLQNKIAQLMREIAILEEKLTAEVLARARAEEELQHLRVCIEERDEKAYKDSQMAEEEVMSLTDSEDGSDTEESEDARNESLEPTFKREDINRSRLMRQSLAKAPPAPNSASEDSLSDGIDDCTAEKVNDTLELEKSDDTLLDEDRSVAGLDEQSRVNHEESAGGAADDELEEAIEDTGNTVDDAGFQEPSDGFDADDGELVSGETVISSSDAVEEKCVSQMMMRGTYFVRRSQDDSKTGRSDSAELDSTNIDRDEAQNGEEQGAIDREDDNRKESVAELREGSESVNIPLNVSETLVNKIIKSLKSTSESHNSNASLAQFEQLEMAANEMDHRARRKTSDGLLKIEIVKVKKTYFDDNGTSAPSIDRVINESGKEKKVYFDNLDPIVESGKKNRISDVKCMANLKCDEFRSPSIVKEDTGLDYEPSTMKLFGESFTRQPDPISIVNKTGLLKKKNDSVDVFECFDSPRTATDTNEVENIRKSINNIVLDDKADNVDVNSKVELNEPVSIEKPVEREIFSGSTIDSSNLQAEPKVDNTLEEFENIYKDVSEARATDFDLLVTQEINSSNSNGDTTATDVQGAADRKYNLRKKTLKKSESEENYTKREIDEHYVIEILKESQAKCESAAKSKRNQRLRRRRQQESEAERERGEKLKDIANLQTQFSDVTMDLPAPQRQARDIASPEKRVETENVPPMEATQSCPSKSVTRSRRKLFTPRAEPLEEGAEGSGGAEGCGASAEQLRVRVLRPSYQRPRARRKL